MIRRIVVIGVCAALLPGCYYMQAASGHLSLMSKREPIETLLERDDLDAAVRDRLLLVRDARRFASDALALPDNGSYRTYVDLDSEAVVWNVFAAPELSIDPHSWCFPVVGCVFYRGHFRRERADREAAKLSRRGYDTVVRGAAAYSTLGRFDDPVLSTMLGAHGDDFVATLFHELAHQQLYVADDTAFNESFASAVAELGLERWLEARGEPGGLAAWRQRRSIGRAFVDAALATRDELAAVYSSDLDDAKKRDAKASAFARLAARYAAIAAEHGLATAPAAPHNNAALVPLASYNSYVDEFRALFERCNASFECFYDESAALASLPDSDARAAALIARVR